MHLHGILDVLEVVVVGKISEVRSFFDNNWLSLSEGSSCLVFQKSRLVFTWLNRLKLC